MAVPRNRMSNARKNSRRSHMAKHPKTVASCPNCSSACLQHRACPACGQYKGRQVTKVATQSE